MHRYMEEDPTPRRSTTARSTKAEGEAQCTEITGQKKQQKVLADLISGQKVLTKELQKQQKVLMAHVEQQREVLGRQQETLNHLLATFGFKAKVFILLLLWQGWTLRPGLPRANTSHQ